MSLPLQKSLTTRNPNASQLFVQLLLLSVRYSHCLQTAQPDASLSHSKPLSQFHKTHGTL